MRTLASFSLLAALLAPLPAAACSATSTWDLFPDPIDLNPPPRPSIRGATVDPGFSRVADARDWDGGEDLVIEIPAPGASQVVFDVESGAERFGVGYVFEVVDGTPPPEPVRLGEATAEPSLIYCGDDDTPLSFTARVRTVDRAGNLSEWSEPFTVEWDDPRGCGASSGAPWLALLLLALRRPRCA